MSQQPNNPEAHRGNAGPLLFYIIAGVIVAALLLFLLLRPMGSDSGPGTSKKSLTEIPALLLQTTQPALATVTAA